MSNFKPGQKVVFIGEKINKRMILPDKNEIVTIESVYKACSCGCGILQYFITEYPMGHGAEQVFLETDLRPLDDTFAEETEAMVQKFATDIEEYLETIKEQELIKTK